MSDFDVLVVGSGATGTMAARTLAEAGARTLIVDGGAADAHYAPLIPQRTFLDIRRSCADQHRYFLGDAFESVAYRKLAAGAQLTPPRRFVAEGTQEWLRRAPTGFAPVESLARGGLAGAWGLNCQVYSDAELSRAGLPAAAMREAYQTVCDRIGLSGAGDDDARPYTYGNLAGVQPPIPLDPLASALVRRYERARERLRAGGFALGRPTLALLTQPRDARRATELRDMDFYDDAGDSAWRAQSELDALLRRPNVAYATGIVTRFEERDGRVRVVALDPAGGSRDFEARRLVLACGALGTARVVLRSLGAGAARLPLLCNDYTYVPCVVPAQIGRSMPERNTGLVRLLLLHDAAPDDVAVGTLFSYRALMLFRLLRETPLGVRDARRLLQYLLSGLLVAGIDHPQAPSSGKSLWLQPDASSPTGDALAVEYALTQAERRAHDARERAYLRALRALGAYAIKRVHPPLGASIHYAGTLPFSDAGARFSLARDGRLAGTRDVFVADGSGFAFLPAKGLTLSLMANAHRVARGVLPA